MREIVGFIFNPTERGGKQCSSERVGNLSRPMEVGTPCGDREKQTLDEATIQLDEEKIRGGVFSQTSLVGKLVTDKELNKGAVKNLLIKAWGHLDGVQVADVGPNKFLFTFNKREEAQEVFNKTPWYVMNRLISLQRWNIRESMEEINFNRVQFWVQLQGLPLEFLTIKNAEKILSQIGTILEVEDPTIEGKLIRSFIRARVEIDIQHPLSTGCWIPRRNLPKIWVSIKYERLQNLCYKCGIIGHDQRTCQKEKVMSARHPNVQRYSLHMGVPPAKPIRMIQKEYERRWRNSQQDTHKEARSLNKEDVQEKDEEARMASQELALNRERVEYMQAQDAQEGNDNLPSGWRERHLNATVPLTTRILVQNHWNNFHVQKEHLGFNAATDDEYSDCLSFPIPEAGRGANIQGDPNPIQLTQLDLRANPTEIPQNKGKGVLEAAQQREEA